MSRYTLWGRWRQNQWRQNQHGQALWRSPAPQRSYDVVVVGDGSGHGVATAYSLAHQHQIRRVAVLEAGPLCGAQRGYPAALMPSDSLSSAQATFYQYALERWPKLRRELGYALEFSACDGLNLAHSQAHHDALQRRLEMMHDSGLAAQWLDRDALARYVPGIDCSESNHFSVRAEGRVGARAGLLQNDAGRACHEATTQGYARAADQLGVDVIDHCEVLGFTRVGERVTGVVTAQGSIAAGRVALVSPNARLYDKLGEIAPLPRGSCDISRRLWQTIVTEACAPLISGVLRCGACSLSQTPQGHVILEGELSDSRPNDASLDHAQQGSWAAFSALISKGVAILPPLARLRLLHHWEQVIERTGDGLPVVTKGPLPGLYLTAAWGADRLKATPAVGVCLAQTIAEDTAHPLTRPFSLECL